MTNKDAIKKINLLKMVAVKKGTDTAKAVDMAIEALKEKQPIKPEIFGNHCRCGKCDDRIMSAIQAETPINRRSIRFCGHCGQPIDWQEFEQGGEQV